MWRPKRSVFPPLGEKWGKQGEKEGKDENVKKKERSGAAGSRFKCADARSRFKDLSTEGSGDAGSRFKCANARSRFKEKQAADYKNFTQIPQSSQIRQQSCRWELRKVSIYASRRNLRKTANAGNLLIIILQICWKKIKKIRVNLWKSVGSF